MELYKAMTKNNKKGFTIIEVVLVLAIAGLIFLMVFIALPALQRSQRNTRRRQDMARILSAFNDYQANNNGKMPDGTGKLELFIPKYVDENCTVTTSGSVVTATGCGDQFTDPDGTAYSIYNNSPLGTNGFQTVSGNPDHQIKYFISGKCDPDTEGKVIGAGGNNNIAIAYILEGGAVYCGDNQ
jgi:prepilin-type N-terminal cleavage/methylation domain-containing protein